MKLVLLLFFIFSFSFCATTVDDKINAKKSDLREKSQLERSISKKLKDVAKEILDEQEELSNITKEIDRLTISIEQNKNLIKDKEENLVDLSNQNKNLVEIKKKLEEKIIKIIAQDFSFYLITDKDYLDSADSILVEEVLDKMDVIMRKEFSKLSREYKHINTRIEVQATQILELRTSIEELKNEKTTKFNLKKKQESIITNLDRKKRDYKEQLDKIEKERRSLRATLEQLKIVKEKEEKQKQKEAEEAKLRQEEALTGKVTVRQIGSSYQDSKVQKYRGRKTIAPLDNFSVKRSFGDYIDPVYKIKIFNESVILSANEENAKVKNVLDGKIIYAKDTAMLDKVVIVENSYGIHTIYAHLSKIAPTISVGKKIKKGYILGRVDRDLTFEVTQKSYHIDPLELIEIVK